MNDKPISYVDELESNVLNLERQLLELRQERDEAVAHTERQDNLLVQSRELLRTGSHLATELELPKVKEQFEWHINHIFSCMTETPKRSLEIHNSYFVKEQRLPRTAKAGCIGEFNIEVDCTCTACFYGEPEPDCEVCAGEINYTRIAEVPWDMQKSIWKKLNEFSSNEIKGNK